MTLLPRSSTRARGLRVAYGVFLLVLFLVVPTVRQVMQAARRHPHPHQGFLGFWYDSAPNLVAAWLSPTLVLLMFGVARQRWPALSIARWYLVSGVFCQIGLLTWEFLQPVVPGATFDWSDIVATVLGGLLWLASWPILRPDRHLEG
jgi:hypothetical protein